MTATNHPRKINAQFGLVYLKGKNLDVMVSLCRPRVGEARSKVCRYINHPPDPHWYEGFDPRRHVSLMEYASQLEDLIAYNKTRFGELDTETYSACGWDDHVGDIIDQLKEELGDIRTAAQKGYPTHA